MKLIDLLKIIPDECEISLSRPDDGGNRRRVAEERGCCEFRLQK